ncbi:hypothetical protein HanRHA438_Chr04g0183051 [Helianthus annuus]|nr:hypothetical protein HanRHA438_Chr04g0183051 [Helianthus annuus]
MLLLMANFEGTKEIPIKRRPHQYLLHWRSLGDRFSQFRGAKTYIPKNFYTKRLFITLRVEKFGRAGVRSRPKEAAPLTFSPPRL